uniref:Uncharacterized protein n=1 Tax=Aegilops tauschii TaxID=37682 RepID=N1R2M9_AEGTA
MEVAANPSRCGAPLLLATKDQGHGSMAGASLLRRPGRTAASPSGDSEQQVPDEEHDDRDLRDAQARPRRSIGALRLSSSMDGDDPDPTLEPGELDEMDSEVVRSTHHGSPENKQAIGCEIC